MDLQTYRPASFDASSAAADPDHEEDEWGYGPNEVGGVWNEASDSALNPHNLTSWKASASMHQDAQVDQIGGELRPFSSRSCSLWRPSGGRSINRLRHRYICSHRTA